MPINRPKIPNADIIGNRTIYNKNNLIMGRQFAGTVLLAPLSIATYVYPVETRVKLMNPKTAIYKNKLA